MSLVIQPPRTQEIRRLLNLESERFAKCCGSINLLNSEGIARSGAYIASNIDCHEQVERAMELGRKLIVEKEDAGGSISSGYTILAEQMTGSKGRFTRAWHAPKGGLWGCIIHANNLLDASRQFLPFTVGISCAESLKEFGLSGVNLRWVNDVLVADKKIAGFLIESFTSPLGENFHMIGFGININNENFPEELKDIATSVKVETGKKLNLTAFAEMFLAKMAWNIGLLEQEEECWLNEECYSGQTGEHIILEKFKSLTSSVGQKVKFGFDVMESPQYEAKVLGFDSMGGLMLELEGGYQKTEYSGEIRYL